MILRVDHVGIAVKSLEERLGFWHDALGMPLGGTETVSTEGVRVAFLPAGTSRVELLEATHPDSPIAKFVDTKGPGIHHLCFSVDDLDATLARAKAAGITLIDEQPRIGAEGKRIAFLHPKSTGGVLIELAEY